MTRFNKNISIVIAVLVSFIAVNTASAQLSQYGREQAQKQQSLNVMAIEKPGPKTTYGGHIDPVIKNQKEVWRRAAGINASLVGIYDTHEMGGFGGGVELGYEHNYFHIFVQGGYSQYSYKGFDYSGMNTKIGAGVTLFKFRNNPNCKGDKYIAGSQLNLDVFFGYDRINTGDTEVTYFVKDYTSGIGARLEYKHQIAEFVSGDHTVPMFISLGGEVKSNDNYGDKTTNKIHFSGYVKVGFKF